MDSLLHRGTDGDAEEMSEGANREITLGPLVILGLFFGLAALCAVFFGLGYSMGRKSVVAITLPAETAPKAVASSTFSNFKPAAGNPVSARPVTPPAGSAPLSRAGGDEERASSASPAGSTVRETTRVNATPAPASPPASNAAGGGTTMVQIAAVSHQEDADLLITTLKRRGYGVSIHSEPQDKLLHVQIGPFTTHKDADAMRQRLLADGFNAIVKDAGH